MLFMKYKTKTFHQEIQTSSISGIGSENNPILSKKDKQK